jgi:hypothetical protein
VLRRLGRHLRAQVLGEFVDVELLQQFAHGGSADIGVERRIALLARLLLQVQELVLVEHLVRAHFLRARLDDDVVGVVDHLLEVTQREVEEVAHGTGQGLEEPDVGDRHGELDVTHPLAAHLGQRDLDAAAIADDAAVPDPLVLAAVALPILHRPEDPLAEQAILFRLERAVVDCFGLGHLAPRPPRAEPLHFEALPLLGIARPTDLLGRGDPDLDEVER